VTWEQVRVVFSGECRENFFAVAQQVGLVQQGEDLGGRGMLAEDIERLAQVGQRFFGDIDAH
jgi:hypothetical protein